MTDTVLNLGLNDASVEGLVRQTSDERFAYDSYRRLIQMYGHLVHGVPNEEFDRLLDAAREEEGVGTDVELSANTLRGVVERCKDVLDDAGASFPQEPDDQLRDVVEATVRDLGTAVNVQVMVFGNRGDHSGTGVGSTRDATTGELGAYGGFLVNAQGEDVVAGRRETEPLSEMERRFPGPYAELLEIFDRLERHYRDMLDTEFTVEQGKLWMLQARVGTRTAAAAVRMAVDMVNGGRWRISREEAVRRITPEQVDQLLHPEFAVPEGELRVLCTGIGASPGAAAGRVYFTADDAADAADRGEKVILVRIETSPEDVPGMMVADGILTARGGLASHAAVIARGWGTPAVVGADALRIGERSFTVDATTVSEGDVVSIGGTTGVVVPYEVPLKSPETTASLTAVLGWADEIRGDRIGVRANADNGPDAARARRFGAEGIGLCRTEHMFLSEDRLPVVQAMILAATPEDETAALERLRVAQRADFRAVLEQMDGLPVTVRLLDPPLHEFLPDVEELTVKEASTGLEPQEQALLVAARSLREVNPMLGTRGVRLGVMRSGLYAMQVRALLEAAADRVHDGGHPVVEVMIPFTVTRRELAEARSWVEQAIADAGSGSTIEVGIGTMIETPRAALRAGELAEVADFFSFGTNDLTQMTFGFSRDDVEATMMGTYLDKGLLERNPFETIDQVGVGELVRLAVQRGRSTRPGLKLGVCGEHGGDPASIRFFFEAGLDYLSCSPFRVPVTRLAAAHAVLDAASR